MYSCRPSYMVRLISVNMPLRHMSLPNSTNNPPSGSTARTWRIGLMAKARLWIALVVVMTLSLAVLTHMALLRWQEGLNEVTGTELDALMESVRLVQQSEVLVSQSLALAQSRSPQERRLQWVDQQDRLDWVRKITQRIAQRDHVDRDLLGRVVQAQNSLDAQAVVLNKLVQQRQTLLAQGLGRDTPTLQQLDAAVAETAHSLHATGSELSLLMGYFSADIRQRLANRSQVLGAQVQRQQNALWGFALALIALVIWMGFYMQRRVVARVLKLQLAVSKPEVDVRQLNPQGHDEIAQLTQTVGHYVDRIQANQEALNRANLDLTYLAEHDPLTHLANRRHFDTAVRRMLPALRTPLALAVFDIDFFKRVNDTYGHDVGDQALVHVAQMLGAALRDRDVLARFGGEEFTVLLPVANMDAALEVCERMRAGVAANPLHLPPVATTSALSDSANTTAAPLVLNVSAGVALIDGLPLSADDAYVTRLMQHTFILADAALYQAKQTGRNRVCSQSDPVHATLLSPPKNPREITP